MITLITRWLVLGLLCLTFTLGAASCASTSGDPDVAKIHNAARHGDVERVRSLIKINGALTYTTDKGGNTPLMWAAEAGHKDVAELLLTNKADVNAKNGISATALSLAAFGGFADLVELLLVNKAEVNARAQLGATALHLAVMGGHVGVVRSLLAHNADVNAKVKKVTPLHLAVNGGHKTIVELLLANNVHPNAKDATASTPLHLAISTFRIKDVMSKLKDAGLSIKEVEKIYRDFGRGGDASTTEKLFPKDFDIGVLREAVIQSSLPPAAIADRVAVVRLLIDQNADVNVKNVLGQTPLELAVMNPGKAMTAILVAARADVNAINKTGESVLHQAVIWGGKETVNLLLDNGAEPNAKNQYGNTPFHLAFLRKDLAVAELLLAHSADINAKNEAGFTPMHAEAQSSRKDAVQFLLTHDAEVDPRDNKGWTPLNRAATKGHKGIAEMLLAHGADVHVRDNGGYTPLNTAAEWGNVGVVGLLLAHNADVNAKTIDGRTPLHLAAKGPSVGQGDLAKWADYSAAANLLISNGADVEATEINGATPLHYAARGGQKTIVDMLVTNGAKTNVKTLRGHTPADWARYSSHYDIVDFLRRLLETTVVSIEPEKIIEGRAAITGVIGQKPSEVTSIVFSPDSGALYWAEIDGYISRFAIEHGHSNCVVDLDPWGPSWTVFPDIAAKGKLGLVYNKRSHYVQTFKIGECRYWAGAGAVPQLVVKPLEHTVSRKAWARISSAGNKAVLIRHRKYPLIVNFETRVENTVGIFPHPYFITGAEFSGNEKQLLLSSTGDDSFHLIDADTGSVEKSFLAHAGGIRAIKFVPSQDRIISTGNDGKLKVWDIALARVTMEFDLAYLTSKSGWVNAIAINPKGSLAFTGNSDGTVGIFPINNQSKPALLNTGQSTITAVTVSPNGKWLATGSDDGSVKVWKVALMARESIAARHGLKKFSSRR